MSQLDIALFIREDEHIGHGEISARRQLGAQTIAFIDLLQPSAVQLTCLPPRPDTHNLHNDLDVTKPPVARCVQRRHSNFTTSPMSVLGDPARLVMMILCKIPTRTRVPTALLARSNDTCLAPEVASSEKGRADRGLSGRHRGHI